jgi:hypothetical protein
VLHGCEKVATLLEADDGLRGRVEEARYLALHLAAGDVGGRAAAGAAAP